MELKADIDKYLAASEQSFQEAMLLYQANLYTGAINRAYYSLFYLTSGLLLTKQVYRSRHSGIISAFGQYFVKTGEIDAEMHHILQFVFEARQNADYQMQLEQDQELCAQVMELAGRFLVGVRGVFCLGWGDE